MITIFWNKIYYALRPILDNGKHTCVFVWGQTDTYIQNQMSWHSKGQLLRKGRGAESRGSSWASTAEASLARTRPTNPQWREQSRSGGGSLESGLTNTPRWRGRSEVEEGELAGSVTLTKSDRAQWQLGRSVVMGPSWGQAVRSGCKSGTRSVGPWPSTAMAAMQREM